MGKIASWGIITNLGAVGQWFVELVCIYDRIGDRRRNYR